MNPEQIKLLAQIIGPEKAAAIGALPWAQILAALWSLVGSANWPAILAFLASLFATPPAPSPLPPVK